MTAAYLDPILVDGVVLTREALAMGISEKQLRSIVRNGLLTRIRHGAYAASRTWARASPDERHRLQSVAVLRRYGAHVALSHQSASLVHGGPSWGLDFHDVHLTHLRGGGRREAGVCHHRGWCSDDELVMAGNLQVTDVTRTVLDVVACNRTEVGVVVTSHFLHVGATTKDVLGEGQSRRREWPGTLAAPIALSLGDSRLESVGESRCWYLFWKSQLPMPVPQYEVLGASGELLARVDFAWPEWGIVVEFDGKQKYLQHRRLGESVADAVLRERRRENRITETTGWSIIRLDWADLAHPDEVVRRVVEVLARRRRAS